MEESKQSKANQYKYHAFISYRHADNKVQGRQWATWLHQAIETYEVPKDLVGKKNGRGDVIPARIYPIFRDEEELPAHADLGTSIVSALEQTNLLVVLCSPRAVASTYVADEIGYFKKLGGSDRIIAAMIDGEPNTSWDESKHSLGFSKEDECFPIPLQFEYDQDGNPTDKHAEPIAADFRINNDGKPEEGFTTPAAYREHLKTTSQLDKKAIEKKVDNYQQQLHLMLLKIIAGILGVPLGELTQRDKEYQLEQERLKAKKLKKWLSVITTLVLLSLALAYFSYEQYEEAQWQEFIAEQKELGRKNNLSELLLSKANQSSKEGNFAYAAFQALSAVQTVGDNESAIIPEATSLWFRYLDSPKISYVRQVFPKKVCRSEVSRDQFVEIIQTTDSSANNKTEPCAKTFENEINTINLTSDEKNVIYTGWGDKNKTIEILDVAGNDIGKLEVPTGEFFEHYSLSTDDKFLVASSKKHILVYKLASQELIKKLPLENGLSCLYLTKSNKQVITCSDRSINIIDVDTGTIVKNIELEKGISKTIFSKNSNLIAVVIYDRNLSKEIEFYDSKSLIKLPSHKIRVSSNSFIQLTPDGSYMTVARDGTLDIHDVQRLTYGNNKHVKIGKIKDSYKFGKYNQIESVFLGSYRGREYYEHKNGSPYPNFLMVISFEGKLEFWDVYNHKKIAAIENQPIVTDAVVSIDGKKVYSAHRDNTVMSWELFANRQIMEAEGSIGKIKFSPTYHSLLSSSPDIEVWDLKSNLKTHEVPVPSKSFDKVQSIDFHENGDSLALITKSGKYTSVNLKPKAKLISEVTNLEHGVINYSEQVIVGVNSNDEIEIIKLASDKKVSIPVKVDTKFIEKMAINQQNQLAVLYHAYPNNIVEMIDINDPLQRRDLQTSLDRAEYMNLSESGSLLLLWNDDKEAKLINTQTDTELFLWTFDRSIKDTAISIDGKLLAIATENGEIYIRDTVTGNQFAKFEIEVGKREIENIEFSNDGNKLAVNVREVITVIDIKPLFKLTDDEYIKTNIEKLKTYYGFEN